MPADRDSKSIAAGTAASTETRELASYLASSRLQFTITNNYGGVGRGCGVGRGLGVALGVAVGVAEGVGVGVPGVGVGVGVGLAHGAIS